VICDTDKIDKEGRYKGVPILAVEVLSESARQTAWSFRRALRNMRSQPIFDGLKVALKDLFV